MTAAEWYAAREPWGTTYEKLVGAILQHQPVTFTRWGNGEWKFIFWAAAEWEKKLVPGCRLGPNRHPSLKHVFMPELAQALTAIIASNPTYRLGLQPLAMRAMGDVILEFLKSKNALELDWINADSVHRASSKGVLDRLAAALSTRKLLLIGPEYMGKLRERLPIEAHVVVPPRDYFPVMERLIEEAIQSLAALGPDTVVMGSAGPPAKIILHRLHAHLEGKGTLIDTGSLWDPYVGNMNRSGSHLIRTEQVPARQS